MLMKKNLLLFSFLLSITALFAQPVNDDCSGLVDLGVAPVCPAVLDTFNNVNATSSMISSNPAFEVPACFNGGIVERDVWFKFTVPGDGSIIDFQITITGVDGPNGAMVQPQVAVYRGECLLDELQELDCASSMLGAGELVIDLEGLTPGLEYFLRITDWSATATPNMGDFVLCIDELPICFNMCGDVTDSQSCEGKLYDSGGPDGDYMNNENCTFTICPTEFHQCIFINVADYGMENNIDELNFYAGPDTNSPQIFSLSGSGTDFEVQASSNCVTIEFDSDGSITDSGFFLEWMCSPDTCTVPPIVSCDEPIDIPSLPYVNDDLTTCFAGNTVSNGPCNEFFINGEDYIFTYDSPGDECIMVDITGSATSTGVAIYNDCPNVATECVASAGGNFNQADPTINAAFLENAGTYYIVVANANNCTDFNITIDTVTCPTILPPASDCEDALSINGCANQPSTIAVSQEPSNNQNFTLGCWGGSGAAFFTWFIFQAQEDGDFGFLAANSLDPLNSDIDINVWGPYTDADVVCGGTLTDEPIRSTWSGTAGVTGLIDTHPVTGVPITDICEGAGGDKFVSTIPVLEGEWYVVLVNDYGGDIVDGLIDMDFTGTDDGVLGPEGGNFSITGDTAICPGENVQLLAEGGTLYQWMADPGLSCVNCPNPVATIAETTTFQVAVFGACDSDTLEVEVGVLQVDAGPDLSVCLNEDIQIVAGANFENVTYSWNGPAGTLSCTDCADPIVTAVNPGMFVYTVTVTGPSCSFTDDMTLEVIDSPAPEYTISDDMQICEGESVDLGGPDTGIDYQWTSFPAGFSSNQSNPSVTPTESTTYILQINNAECPVPSFDSVFVEVSALPIAETLADVNICQSDSTQLSAMVQEDGVAYTWSPAGSLDDANSPNPVAFPTETTTYTVIADRNGCSNTETITVSVTQIAVEVTVQDTFGICVGESIDLSALATPVTDIVWTPNDGSLNTSNGTDVVASPATATQYFAEVTIDGCVRRDSVYIRVDSLPVDLAIMPADTTVCEGSPLLLTSTIYEPALYQDITFQWSPPAGFQTPDSLYNMSLIADESTVYQRISTNGFCADTTFVNVEVVSAGAINIDPVDPVCAGEVIQLMASTDLEGDLVWTGEGLSCTDCPNPMATTPLGATSATYSVELDGYECPVEASITVDLIDAPNANIADEVLCPNENVTLNTGGNPDYTYTWFSADDTGFNTSADASPVVMPTQTSQYFVTVTNGACPDFIDSLTVFVDESVSYTEPMDIEICNNETGLLSFSATLPGTIAWAGPLSGNCNNCQTLDLPIDLTTPGLYDFTVSYSNSCGETASFDAAVEVFEAPVATLAEATICPGDIVILNPNGSPNFDYQWSNGSSNPTQEVSPNLTTEYFVTVSNGTVCADFVDSTTITVISDYTLIVSADTTIRNEEMVTLTATAVFNDGGGTVPGDYTWLLNDNEIGNSASITVSPTEPVNVYQVMFMDANNCSEAADSVIVRIVDVEIPNAFTPNGDSNNDVFGLVTGDTPVNILEYRIYNRWGNVVFEVNDGLSTDAQWNGGKDNDDSKPVPADVYIYYIRYQVGDDGEIITAKGDVTLIR